MIITCDGNGKIVTAHDVLDLQRGQRMNDLRLSILGNVTVTKLTLIDIHRTQRLINADCRLQNETDFQHGSHHKCGQLSIAADDGRVALADRYGHDRHFRLIRLCFGAHRHSIQYRIVIGHAQRVQLIIDLQIILNSPAIVIWSRLASTSQCCS